MSILVTGGAGYIGSQMVLELLETGEEPIVLDDLSTGFRVAIPREAKFIRGDVGDERLVSRVIDRNGVDAIVHFAGSVVVPNSVKDPLAYYLNNTCKSRNLIACAIKARVEHFIFSSSAAVYGMAAENPVTEQAEPRPISPYGTSKLMTEIMLRDAAAAFPLRYVALRYFNVAGADPHGRTGQSTLDATHLVKVAVQAALGQRPYPRYSARTIRPQMVHASAITFMSATWHAHISTRFDIYGPVVALRYSIAAMDAAHQSWK